MTGIYFWNKTMHFNKTVDVYSCCDLAEAKGVENISLQDTKVAFEIQLSSVFSPSICLYQITSYTMFLDSRGQPDKYYKC